MSSGKGKCMKMSLFSLKERCVGLSLVEKSLGVSKSVDLEFLRGMLSRIYALPKWLCFSFLWAGLFGCVTSSSAPVATPKKSPVAKSLLLPAWMTAPDARERTGVPVDLKMQTPLALRSFEHRYALPPWMIYGTVRVLGMQRMRIEGDVKSYALVLNGQSSALPEEDELIYFVPEADIHRALMAIVQDCSSAKNEDELNQRFARYVQRLYKERYALFSLSPSDEPLGGGSSQTVEIFKSNREDLPVIGWGANEHFYETTVAGTYNSDYPLESFIRAEELGVRDLVEGIRVKLQSVERVENVQTNSFNSHLAESAVKESLNLELRGVEVIRRAVDVDQGICLVTVRVPKDGVVIRR